MKNLLYYLTACLIILTTSCSNDDNNPEVLVLVPVIGVDSENVEADFFTEGSLAAPAINWGGEEGSLELNSPIQGVNLNAVTGVITYDKSLPVGESVIQFVASNSAGQTTQSITINNRFSGSFTGEYTSGDNQDFIFTHKANYNEDGSYTGEDSNNADSTTTGTWTLSGNTISSTYTYDSGSSPLTIEVDLTQSTSDATLNGAWHSGASVSEDSFGGYIRFSIDQ